MQLFDPGQKPLPLFNDGWSAAGQFELGDLHHQVFPLRQEFVQRRIQESNGDGKALHFPVEADEILLLQRQQLIEILFTVLAFPGQNHLLHDRNAIFGEEHMLGAAQSDPFRPECPRNPGLIRHVGVSPDLEAAHLVGPFQDRIEQLVLLRFGGVSNLPCKT